MLLVVLAMMLLVLMVLMLLVRRPVVHIVITTRMMMRSAIQSRVAVGVRAWWYTGLTQSYTLTSSSRSRSLRSGSGRRINRRILDVHERLAHPNSITSVRSTIVGIRLAVVRSRVVIWQRRRIALLAALPSARLALGRAAGTSLTSGGRERMLCRGLLRCVRGGRFAMIVLSEEVTRVEAASGGLIATLVKPSRLIEAAKVLSLSETLRKVRETGITLFLSRLLPNLLSGLLLRLLRLLCLLLGSGMLRE